MHIIEEINIRKMIVHILDHSLSIPILSMEEIPSSLEIKDYMNQHILKVINEDALKTCDFDEIDNPFLVILKDYLEERKNFVDFSIDIASALFNIMVHHPLIPACDLAVLHFHLQTEPHLAIMKLNYQSTFTHFTDYESDKNVNTIMEHKTTLPGPGQKVSEAVIIRLSDLTVKVLERKHELDGTLDYYLSKHFLACHVRLSSKEQMQIVKTTTDQVAKKFYDDNPEKKAEIKQKLFETLDEHGTINLEAYAAKTFKDEVEVKEVFLEKLEKKGLVEPLVKLEEKTIVRSFEKQRVKTDTGIEIKIPMSLYNDPSAMEFVTGPDGKINIILKNIGKIL